MALLFKGVSGDCVMLGRAGEIKENIDSGGRRPI
jgi:hypothetical protein